MYGNAAIASVWFTKTRGRMNLPIIDLREEKSVEKILDAAVSSGFFYIQNHGIPVSAVNKIFQISNEFFCLDRVAKEPYAIQENNRVNTLHDVF